MVDYNEALSVFDQLKNEPTGVGPSESSLGGLAPQKRSFSDLANDLDSLKPEQGYGEIIGKGLVRGAEGMASGAGAALNWAGEVAGSEPVARAGKTVQEYFDKAAREGWAAPDPKVFRGEFMENPSFKRAAGIIAEAGASLGGALVLGGGVGAGARVLGAGVKMASKIGGVTAAGGLGLLEGAPQYGEAREAGKSIGYASGIGAASTVGTAMLEFLAINRFLKPLKGNMGRVAKTAITEFGPVESLQEVAQTGWQNLIARYGYDETKSLTEGMIEAAIGGFGAGAISGTAGHVGNQKINDFIDRQRKKGTPDQEISSTIENVGSAVTQAMEKKADEVTQKPVTDEISAGADAMLQQAEMNEADPEDIIMGRQVAPEDIPPGVRTFTPGMAPMSPGQEVVPQSQAEQNLQPRSFSDLANDLDSAQAAEPQAPIQPIEQQPQAEQAAQSPPGQPPRPGPAFEEGPQEPTGPTTPQIPPPAPPAAPAAPAGPVTRPAGVDIMQDEYIKGRIAQMGSLEAVKKAYSGDSTVEKYARAVAEERFSRPQAAPAKAPESAKAATTEATQATAPEKSGKFTGTPGWAFLDDKQRPITAAREITKGKNKGKFLVTFGNEKTANGNPRERMIPADAIRQMPVAGPAPAAAEATPPPAAEAPKIESAPAPQKQAQPVKEPWQMSRGEFDKEKNLRKSTIKQVTLEKAERVRLAKETGLPQGASYGRLEEIADRPVITGTHKEAVRQALSDGLPVPPEVLKNYPDLAKAQQPATQPALNENATIAEREKTARPAWNSATPEQREAIAKQAGWATPKGNLTPKGKAISKSNWDKLSPAAQRIVSNLMPGEATAEQKAAEKEPWEMTQVQAMNRKAEKAFPTKGSVKVIDGKPVYTLSTTVKWGNSEKTIEISGKHQQRIEKLHKEVVKQALVDGLPVPAEVLADYPDLTAAQAETKPSAPKPKLAKPAKESKITTLRGRILKMGKINPGNMKGEFKDAGRAVSMLLKKDGQHLDLAEQTLRDEGWLGQNENLVDVLRDPENLRRNKVAGEGVEKREQDKTEQEKQFEREMNYEAEEPPPGDYIMIDAEDLPEGKKLTILDDSAAGYDTYEVTEKDAFSITLKDGRTIELTPNQQVQVRREDLPEKVQEKAEEPDADRESVVAELKKKELYGTVDRLERGKITLEDAKDELAGGKPKNVTQPKELNPADAAAEMKGAGIGRQDSWSKWVQRTALRPGMDAKDWYRIYDSVTPAAPATAEVPKAEAKAPAKEEPKKIVSEYDRELERLGLKYPIEAIKKFGKDSQEYKDLQDLEKNEGEDLLEEYRKEYPTGAIVLENKEKTNGYIITKSAKEPGRWQATSWDERGFSGDMSFKTEADAIKEIARMGYDTIARDKFAEVSKTDKFIDGVAAAEKIQKEHRERMLQFDKDEAKAEEPKPSEKPDFTRTINWMGSNIEVPYFVLNKEVELHPNAKNTKIIDSKIKTIGDKTYRFAVVENDEGGRYVNVEVNEDQDGSPSRVITRFRRMSDDEVERNKKVSEESAKYFKQFPKEQKDLFAKSESKEPQITTDWKGDPWDGVPAVSDLGENERVDNNVLPGDLGTGPIGDIKPYQSRGAAIGRFWKDPGLKQTHDLVHVGREAVVLRRKPAGTLVLEGEKAMPKTQAELRTKGKQQRGAQQGGIEFGAAKTERELKIEKLDRDIAHWEQSIKKDEERKATEYKSGIRDMIDADIKRKSAELEDFKAKRENLITAGEKLELKPEPVSAKEAAGAKVVKDRLENEKAQELSAERQAEQMKKSEAPPDATTGKEHFDREKMIQSILDAVKKTEPQYKIVERKDLKGTDGKWHTPSSMPVGVKSTGETRSYFVKMSVREGTTYGNRFDSMAEAEAAEKKRLDQKHAADKTEFSKLSDSRLKDASEYWEKELQKSQRLNAPIEDFGQKIGGARKDTAERGFKKGEKVKKESAEPTWKKKFHAAESIKEPGKWSIVEHTKDRWGFTGSSQKFNSKEEAEKAIPLYAVAKSFYPTQSEDGTWELTKKVGERKRLEMTQKKFPSREEAMKYMATNAEALLNTKTSFGEEILPVPDTVNRKGAERRTGPATKEMFAETFAPRGIEFGNWNNQEERQLVMDHAYDGLLDLADALGVPPKALMLNGELAIAFGARGQGLSGAKAHYEPDYSVINLTKMKGAGSLAHEWMHVLDHHLARVDTKAESTKVENARGDKVFPEQADKYLFQSHGPSYKSAMRTELKEAYDKLIKTMLKKGEQYVEDSKRADEFLSKARESLKQQLDAVRNDISRDQSDRYTWRKSNRFTAPASTEQLSDFDRMANTLLEGGDLETKFVPNENSRGGWGGRHTNDTLEAMNVILKSVRNRIGFSKEGAGFLDRVRQAMNAYKQRLKMFEDAQAGTEKTKNVPTNYAIEARKMDQTRVSDYWSEPHEMAARAFASYVEDKIAEKGGQSDFLVYHAHGGIILPMIDGFIARPYPEGSERTAINKAFDEFVKTVNVEETDKGVTMLRAGEEKPATPSPTKQEVERIQQLVPVVEKAMRTAGLPQEVIDRVRVELKPIIDLTDKEADESLKQWAKEGKTMDVILGATTFKKWSALMELSLEQDLNSLEKTTYHEAYHIAAEWMLTPEDNARVGRFYRTDEGAAEAFADLVSRRSGGQPAPVGAVRRAFLKLRNMLEAIGNFLRGRGITKPEEIFGKLMRGEMAPHFGRDVRGATALKSEERAPVWYSQMEKFLAAKLPGSGTAKSFMAPIESWAKKGEIKNEELEWSGLKEWLGEQSGKISKQQVLDYLAANNVRVQEVVKGGVPFDGWTEQQIADHYLALTDQIPLYDNIEELRRMTSEAESEGDNGLAGPPDNELTPVHAAYQLPGGENYRELLLTLPEKESTGKEGPAGWAEVGNSRSRAGDRNFRSTHYQEPNILAHIRFNERVDADGKRVLFIEEVQSDWAQKGRKEGFARKEYKIIDPKGYEYKRYATKEEADAELDLGNKAWRNKGWIVKEVETGIPDAPFVKDTGKWSMLAMKRMVRWAAENGFDSVAWTTGEQQIDRYEEALRRKVDKIEWATQTSMLNPEQSYKQVVAYKDGKQVFVGEVEGDQITNGIAGGKSVEEVFGKDIAAKMSKDINGSLEGKGLSIGGEGMKGYYDQILPQEVNKFFGKAAWGNARVGETVITPSKSGNEWRFSWKNEKGISSRGGETVEAAETNKPKSNGPWSLVDNSTSVHSLPITPQMREKSLTEGMTQFKLGRKPAAEASILDEILPAHTQERAKQALKGVDTGRVLERIKEGAKTFAKTFTPGREHIAMDPRHFGKAYEILRNFKATKQYADRTALDKLTEILDPKNMGKRDYELFSLKISLDDLARELEEGGKYENWEAMVEKYGSLQFGFKSADEVNEALEKANRLVGENKTVKDALKRRDEITTELLQQVVDAKLLPAEVLQDRRYFHHQVLEYLNDRYSTGTGAASFKVGQKGYQRGRIENVKDYSLAYIESEFEVMAHQINQLEKKKNLDEMGEAYNIAKELKRQAKHDNYVAIVGGQENFDRINELRRQIADLKSQGGLDSDEKKMLKEWADEVRELDPTMPFRTKMAIGFSKLSKVLGMDVDESGDFDSVDMAELARLADSTDEAVSIPARSIFKAMGERNRFIKETLGGRFVTELDLARDRKPIEGSKGWTEWVPNPRSAWYLTGSIQDAIAQQIMAGSRELQESDIRPVLARGQDETWIIPAELAQSLESEQFNIKQHENIVSKVAESTLNMWKRWILLNPMRIIKYNLNNTSGDFDIAMAYNPKIFKNVKQAAADLWSWHYGKDMNPALKSEIDKALRDEVIGSGMTVHDIPDVRNQEGLRQLMDAMGIGDRKAMRYVERFWQGSKNFTTWRENVLRLAAYRHFKDEIRAGKSVYGASIPAKVNAIEDRDRKAALLSRELVGDYGALSQGGQWLRRKVVPFYSWLEINAPRYYRMYSNLAVEGEPGGRKVRMGAVFAKKGVFLSAKVFALYAAAQMFNHLFWPDEEEELGEVGRRQAHIILGRREDGSIITLRLQGALSDALSWFSLEDFPHDMRELATGKKSIGKFAGEAALAPANKFVQGTRPEFKGAGELLTGRTLYPDITKPRPIRDRAEYVAQMLSADGLYRRAMGRPLRGDSTEQRVLSDLLSVFTYSADPAEVAYYKSRDLVNDYLKEHNLEKPMADPTSKVNALYYYKQALKFGDARAAEKYLGEYKELGGNMKGISMSVKRAHPLGSLPNAHRAKFFNSLDPESRQTIKRGTDWYRSTFKGGNA